MSRRRRPRDESDPFDDAREMSFENVADAGYGSLVEFKGERQSITALPVSIYDIVPDMAQPRRTIPSIVRREWDGDPRSIPTLFDVWLAAIAEERGSEFPLEAYFHGENTERAPSDTSDDSDGPAPEFGALEASFLKVVELAVSIRRDGLTNPISVVRKPHGLVIETGERRWLAYHLLQSKLPNRLRAEDEAAGRDWTHIPARHMQHFDVWRQASENNARADLNAIAKARQLALLLMDLHGRINFKDLHEFEHEQDFYAQVADAKDWPTPKGAGERILSAMSLEHRNVVLRHRALLRLPREVWELADDLNWPEGRLRQLTPPTPAKKAIQIARRWAGLSPIGDTKTRTSEKSSTIEQLAASALKIRQRAVQQAKRADRQTRLQLRQLAEEQMAWWQQFIEALDD